MTSFDPHFNPQLYSKFAEENYDHDVYDETVVNAKKATGVVGEQQLKGHNPYDTISKADADLFSISQMLSAKMQKVNPITATKSLGAGETTHTEHLDVVTLEDAKKSAEAEVNDYYVDTLASAKDSATVSQSSSAPKLELAGLKNAIAALTETDKAAQLELTKDEEDEIAAKKPRPLEARFNMISQQIDALLALPPSEENLKKITALCAQFNQCMQNISATTSREYINELNARAQKIVEKIQASYNSWKSVIITVVSAVISIAGGLAGLAPFMSFIAVGKATALNRASQAFTTAGSSVGSLGSIANNQDQSIRDGLQHTKQVGETSIQEARDKRQREKERAREAGESKKQTEQMEHDTFRGMAQGG